MNVIGGRSLDVDPNREIERAQAAREKLLTIQHAGSIVPAPDVARSELELAAAAVAATLADRGAAAIEVRARRAAMEAADGVARAAKREAAAADEAAAAAVAQESSEWAAGATTTEIDLGAIAAAREAAHRRHAVLAAKVAPLTEPLKAAEAALAAADDRLGTQRTYLARAELMLAAAETLPAMLALLPRLEAYEKAVANGGEEARQIGRREIRRARRQLTASLAPILDESAVEALGEQPRPPSTPQALEAGVVLYVRPGENYGGHRSGARVLVSEEEAAVQLRVDAKSGRPLGALMSPEENDAIAAAAADRARPTSVGSEIKRLVELGLAQIKPRLPAPEAPDVAKVVDSALIRMAEHAAAVRAGEREDRLTMKILDPIEE